MTERLLPFPGSLALWSVSEAYPTKRDVSSEKKVLYSLIVRALGRLGELEKVEKVEKAQEAPAAPQEHQVTDQEMEKLREAFNAQSVKKKDVWA